MFQLVSSKWIYVIAITFQLSGALLLLIKYCFENIEKGIQKNENRENRVEGNMLILGQTQPSASEYRENVWLNRLAFAYIAAGYLIGIWGDLINIKKIVVLVWVVFLSAILTCVSFFGAKRLHNNKGTN